MTFDIKRLPDLPVLLGIWHEDFVFQDHVETYARAMHKQLNQQQTPVFYVLDLSHWDEMTVEELIAAAHISSSGNDPNFHHPMNRKSLLVTTDSTVKMAVEGLNSEAFGRVDALIFSSVENALAYVREHC